MTPIRETIARAMYEGAPRNDYGEAMPCWSRARKARRAPYIDRADAVLRALDEAGLVVVPKTMPDAVAWAICPIVQDEAGFVCKQCPATVEHNGKSGVMGCRGHCADIYRAMISAATAST